jgi:phosphatidylethanolamine/phosphatidyl-N-methylethanolamine N-methyltransferase
VISVDVFRFMRGFFAHPRAVSSLFPSSVPLANLIARQVDPKSEGLVLELGPGTGPVTQALLNHGVPSDRLLLIERSPAFAGRLRSRFRGVKVEVADAFDIDGYLAKGLQVNAVVCGLPLLNFEVRQQAKLIDGCLDRMDLGAPFVQLTFGLKPPAPPRDVWNVRRAGLVLRNIPPATVWVYTRRNIS